MQPQPQGMIKDRVLPQPQEDLSNQPKVQVLHERMMHLEEITKSTKLVLHPQQNGRLLQTYNENMVLQPHPKNMVSFQASTFMYEDKESILVDAGDIEMFPHEMVIRQQEVLPQLVLPQPMEPMQPEVPTAIAPTLDLEPEVEDLSTKAEGQGDVNTTNWKHLVSREPSG